jgi:hypothetical protein
MDRLIAALDYDQCDLFAIHLDVEEALVNAVQHGHPMEHNQPSDLA